MIRRIRIFDVFFAKNNLYNLLDLITKKKKVMLYSDFFFLFNILSKRLFELIWDLNRGSAILTLFAFFFSFIKCFFTGIQGEATVFPFDTQELDSTNHPWISTKNVRKAPLNHISFTKSYTHVIYAYNLTVIYIDCYINYLINLSSFEIMYNLRLDLNNKKIKVSGGKRFSTINVPSFSYMLC